MQNVNGKNVTAGGRKRPRSNEDDCDECMPISKRINKLQIRSRQCSTDEDVLDGEAPINNNCNVGHGLCCTNGWTDQQQILVNGSVPGQPGFIGNPGNSHLPLGAQHAMLDGSMMQEFDQNMLQNYDPELDSSENPHYYRANELLYQAHVARIHRQRQVFKNS